MKPPAVLRVSREDGLWTLTLDQPGKRNTLGAVLRAALRQAVEDALRDPAAWGMVITGTPGIVFAAGADLGELGGLDPTSSRSYALEGQTLHQRIASAPWASVAAVDGFCYGGGLDLALSCDLRVATDRARFRHPGAHLGILTGWGGTRRLPDLVALGPAARRFLTGKEIAGGEALELGLVDRLVEPGSLVEAARGMIEGLRKRVAAGAHRPLLEVTLRAGSLPREGSWAREREQIRLLLRTGLAAGAP